MLGLVGAAGIFLEGWARPLVVLHGLLGLAAFGASTHLAIAVVQRARGRPFGGKVGLYAWLVPTLYVGCFCVGLLAYPNYRYQVRGLYLDRYEPWASNLFDMKENVAALGLSACLVLFALRRGPAQGPTLLWATVAVWTILCFASLSGMFVTLAKGV